MVTLALTKSVSIITNLNGIAILSRIRTITESRIISDRVIHKKFTLSSLNGYVLKNFVIVKHRVIGSSRSDNVRMFILSSVPNNQMFIIVMDCVWGTPHQKISRCYLNIALHWHTKLMGTKYFSIIYDTFTFGCCW